MKGTRKRKGAPVWHRVVGLGLLNIALPLALQAGIELFLSEVFHVRGGLKITRALPMPWTMAKDILRALAIREVSIIPLPSSMFEFILASATQVLQYYIHRYLHQSTTLPGGLHKSYAHSITAPYNFTALYDHPLPYILTTFLPIYLPSILFRTHILTHLLIISLTSLESAFPYSGYTNPPIMVNGMSRRRDAHMKSGGKGNFAPWGVMDWICGASVGGDVVGDAEEASGKWLDIRSGGTRRRSSRRRA